MNKTKRALIITTMVLNFLSIAWNAFLLITTIISLVAEPYNAYGWFLVFYEGLGILAYIAATVLLGYSIASKGVFFRQRNGYYMTALIMVLILDTFSISSILLLITLFMSDWVWVKPQDDVYFKPQEKKQEDKPLAVDDKAKRIEELRKLKEEGKITEEEFNDALFKLL